MLTLKDARREFVSRIHTPDYIDSVLVDVHQDEYILPVFDSTTFDEIQAVVPPDVRHLVLARIYDHTIEYAFVNWMNPTDTEEVEHFPGYTPDEPADPIDGSITVGEMKEASIRSTRASRYSDIFEWAARTRSGSRKRKPQSS